MVRVVWRVVSNPSRYRDVVFGSCVLGDYVFSVGLDEARGFGRQRYRVEARYRGDGSLYDSWVDEEVYSFASLYSCSVLGDNIYVVGASERFWSIIVFSKELDVINRKDFDRPMLIPFSIASGDGYLYIAGTSIAENGTAITVLKVSPENLSIEAIYSSISMKIFGGAYSIAYNDVNKRIVVGGFDRIDNVYSWRIEILDTNLNLVKVIRPGIRGAIKSISIGINGDIYAVGRNGIVRFNRDGDIVKENRNIGGIEIYTPQKLGTAMDRNIAIINNNEFYLLKEDLTTIESIRIPRGTETISFIHGTPAFDGTKLYISGTEENPKEDWSWNIIAIDPRKTRKIFSFKR